jgi:hypothetical protein
MTDDKHRVITAREAASIIYNTPNPTSEQVGRVGLRIVRGVLRGSGKGDGTTTRAAVAEYLAAQATPRGAKTDEDRQLSSAYRGVLKDYFLAVVARRKMTHRSKGFAEAVLIGQIFLLLAAAAALWFGSRLVVEGIAPEHAAVHRWLDENVPSYHKVEQWGPVHPDEERGGNSLRVRYAYRESDGGKIITTERLFNIRDGVATMHHDE